MSKKLQTAFWEAIKEPLRILVLAAIPVAVAWFKDLPYEWAALAVLILKTIDSILHEIGKVKKDDLLITGLTRF